MVNPTFRISIKTYGEDTKTGVETGIETGIEIGIETGIERQV